MSPPPVKRFPHDVSHRPVSSRGRRASAGPGNVPGRTSLSRERPTARPGSCPVRSAGDRRPRDHGAPFGRCDVPGRRDPSGWTVPRDAANQDPPRSHPARVPREPRRAARVFQCSSLPCLTTGQRRPAPAAGHGSRNRE